MFGYIQLCKFVILSPAIASKLANMITSIHTYVCTMYAHVSLLATHTVYIYLHTIEIMAVLQAQLGSFVTGELMQV